MSDASPPMEGGVMSVAMVVPAHSPTLSPSLLRSAIVTGGKCSSQWVGSANLTQ